MPGNIGQVDSNLKGTTRGLSDMFLPLVIYIPPWLPEVSFDTATDAAR